MAKHRKRQDDGPIDWPDPFAQAPKSVLSPREYDEATSLELCRRIRTGRSLRSVCNDDDMPSLQTFYAWLDASETLRERYARAKQESAEADADDIDHLRTLAAQGKIDPNAARVAIDAIKWSAGQKKPKKYGRLVQVEHDVGGTLEEMLEASFRLPVPAAPVLAAPLVEAIGAPEGDDEDGPL